MKSGHSCGFGRRSAYGAKPSFGGQMPNSGFPPVAVPEQVRFPAVNAADVDDCVGRISADPVSGGNTQERTSRRACFLMSTEDQGAVGRDLGGYCLQLPTAGVHLEGLNVAKGDSGAPAV